MTWLQPLVISPNTVCWPSNQFGVLSFGIKKNWLPPVLAALVLAIEMVQARVAAVVRLVGDGVGGPASALRFGCLGAVAVAEPLGGVSTGTVTVGEIATLNHEIINDTVEDGAVVIAVLHEEFEVLHVDGASSG